VDWYWMVYEAGKYLAERHPKGSGKTTIALLLGPRTRGGTNPVTTGFYEAIKNSDIHIFDYFCEDKDKELQSNLVKSLI
ncbi:TMAO reductase system protein TorT, partial [Vibrio parahaemolyticus]|nr:TMAO reductase system protein TorT [Vibrio parahaemolyticus]